MNVPDPMESLSSDERLETLDSDQLAKEDSEIFFETLEYAERLWSDHALHLINGAVSPDLAISICADACALEHQNMRARWTFENLNGLELPGTRRSISASEAAIDAIEGLLEAAEPPTSPALRNVWKKRFTQRVHDEMDRRRKK